MAATGVGSIGFMNISLHLNSVGFYQITKLAIVPATLCAQSLLFGVSTSTKIKLSLSVLLLGLGLATVTDVQLNAPGFIIGIAAALSTTIFQLWQGGPRPHLHPHPHLCVPAIRRVTPDAGAPCLPPPLATCSAEAATRL